MNDLAEKAWLPSIANVSIESATGSLWPDGWISGEVSLLCTALADLPGIEMQGWNPDWCAVYAHNVVSLAVDDEQAITNELYMGELFLLRTNGALSKGQRFVIRIASKAVRPGDALDARERGIVLSRLAAAEAIGR